MKPYIEKNDGVPDNNRYSEALEAAKETVEALNKLTDQALAQYTALVDSAVAGHITDERELEHIMDGLLDFGDDLRFLEIYKRLCRHSFYKHPQMVGEHIYLWRMQFDTKDEEDENAGRTPCTSPASSTASTMSIPVLHRSLRTLN